MQSSMRHFATDARSDGRFRAPSAFARSDHGLSDVNLPSWRQPMSYSDTYAKASGMEIAHSEADVS
jgi:hypothetical protein